MVWAVQRLALEGDARNVGVEMMEKPNYYLRVTTVGTGNSAPGPVGVPGMPKSRFGDPRQTSTYGRRVHSDTTRCAIPTDFFSRDMNAASGIDKPLMTT